MCVISMVHDYYTPKFYPPTDTGDALSNGFKLDLNAANLATQIAELKKLIAEFKEACVAAKKVDALTNQPNCIDPEKVKLLDRVMDLEKQLAKFKTPKVKKTTKLVKKHVAKK